eukprot:gene8973-9931_t
MNQLIISLAVIVLTSEITCNYVDDKDYRWIEVAILTAPEEDNKELNTAIVECKSLVNEEWRHRQHGTNRVKYRLNVGKVALPPENLFDKAILKKRELTSAAFVIEAYAVHPFSCILSDLLGIPQITLTDEHNPACKNVLSMRPNTAQLYDSTLAMIRRSKSRIVAVIIEDSMGETAIKFMSQGKLAQRFPFQVVGKINFKKNNTIEKTIKKLKDSGIKRVLMMMHSRHVNRYGLLLDDYKWFLPLMEFSIGLVNMSRLRGVSGVRIPSKFPISNAKGQCKYPAIYDAFNLVLNASIRFEDISRYLDTKASSPVDEEFCPTKSSHDYGMDLLNVAKKIRFHGRTGFVKFKKNGYRDVAELEATEIEKNGKFEKLGIWSAKCKKMIWDPKAEDDKKFIEFGCKTPATSTGPLSDFKPSTTELRVVTHEGPPFIFYDKTKANGKLNEAYSGFCKDLLDRLSSDLNFTYRLYIVVPGNYGGSSSNGTSNGMIRDLINKDADIAIGSFTITAEREKAIDFTKPFMDFTMSLIMEKPPQAEVNIFAFLQPFKLELWVSVAAIIFITGSVLFVLDRYSPAGFREVAMKKGEGTGEEFNLRNSIWFMAASMLQQGPDYTPRGAGGRILAASFWFFSIIIVSTYTANLAAFFTKKSMETSIKSLEDLAKQDKINYGVLDGGQTQSFFKNSKLPLYRKMYGQMESRKTFAKSTSSAIQQVREGGYAYLTEHPMLSYYNQQQPCNTVLLKNLLEAKSYGLGLRIDSEWTNPLSVQILKLRERGVVEQIRRKWWDQKSSCPVAQDVKVKTPSLEFMSVAGVYVILACGAILALAMLFVEVKYPDLFTKNWRTACKPKPIYDTNGGYGGHEKSYLDTIDAGFTKPAPFPGADEYNTTNAKDLDYPTKKYFDSLRTNRHYRD